MSDKDHVVRKKTPKKDSQPEEERDRSLSKEAGVETPGVSMFHDQFGLEMLQDQVGNLAVQQVLAQGNGGLADAGPGALAHVQRQLDEESQEDTVDHDETEEMLPEVAEEEAVLEEEQEAVEEEPFLEAEQEAIEEEPFLEAEQEAAEEDPLLEAVEEEPLLEVEQEAIEENLAESENEETIIPDELVEADGPVTEDELNVALIEQIEDQNEGDSEDALEVGDIEIKKPDIDYYDIKANSLEEAMSAIDSPEKWFEFEYDYDLDTDNDIVIEANISIEVAIHMPRWTGPGWENALPAEQAQWQSMMTAFQIYDDEFNETTELPPSVLLGPAWEDAPDALKTGWASMLQDIQDDEEGLLDMIYRRAMVLQQRLINQPEKETNAIFDEFMDDLDQEEKEYNRQRDAQEQPDISLSGNVLVQ